VPSWDVEIVPNGIPTDGAQAIYQKLSALLGHNPSAATIAWTIWKNRWRPYTPVVVKPDVSDTIAMVIKQLHSELPGVRADPSSVRNYVNDPQLSLSHILGYTGVMDSSTYSLYHKLYPIEHAGLTDQVGMQGIEASMDPYLHGVNSIDEVEVDAGERPIRVLRHGRTVAGDSIYVTIDSNLQRQVAADLQTGLDRLNVRQGVAILEDVHTGQILSMVSLPSYDNNWYAGGISAKHLAALMKDPAQPQLNLATQGQFPQGSIFKVITATAALQTGAVNADTIVDDNGAIQLPGHTYNGWARGGLGPMNIVSALALSSDIYFYTVAGGNPEQPAVGHAGATAVARYSRLYGLGQPTGIELPEQPGFVPSPAWYNSPSTLGTSIRPNASYTWHIGDTYNMAIGQGFNLATPLQMVNVTATIANGGTLYRPTLIKEIVGRLQPRRGITRRTTVIQPFVPQAIRDHFVNPANLQLIQQGMHQGVSNSWSTGTSYYVYDPRIDAAGKTGTAEAPTGGVDAWWIGYAPFNHPKVAVVVMVPNAGGEGAFAAAPIAHKLFEDYFHLKADPNPLDNVQAMLVGAR
jgi:penicillin-binding protein 2